MRRGALRETNRTCPLRFNPHVSRRRDCKLSARIAGDHDIRQTQHGMALFQSTRRVGRLSPDQQVSIHAPARGARRSSSSRQQASSEFSIHAFEREQGHHRRRDRTELLRFNPRCVRRNHSFPEYSAAILVRPRVPRGTRRLAAVSRTWMHVSTRVPRARREQRGGSLGVQLGVSIHVSRAGHDDVGIGVNRWLSVSRLAHSNSINSTPCGMRAWSILIS